MNDNKANLEMNDSKSAIMQNLPSGGPNGHPAMDNTNFNSNGESSSAVNVREPNPVMKENAFYFLAMALVYGACFAVAFYRNFKGMAYPVIIMVTLAACGLFLKKCRVPWKKSNWWYVGGSMLLGISTVLTASGFVIFFNTVGVLLLITVFMIRQIYDDRKWGLGQYVCNILFLYLCMIPELARPFIHMAECSKRNKKEQKKNKNTKYILAGILIGMPMLVVVVGLLSSADQIFSRFVGNFLYNLFGKVVFSPNIFLVVLLIVLGFFGIYCFFSALTLNNMPEWKQKGRKKNPVTAITFLSMITAVYLIFCIIQAVFLFTGGKLLPKEYTYAEYAHQGFFQLLFLCMFNLVLVLLCLAVFWQNKMLKILLTVFSGCTYVMIASSAFRMLLYIEAYHLSFLRVLVLWFLGMLAFLMAGVLINIVKGEFGLFRYSMIVATVFYLFFSYGRADVLVASYNVAQLGDAMGYEDVVYLANLSIDAAPVLKQCRFEHEHANAAEESALYWEYMEYGCNYLEEGQRAYIPGCRRCRLDKYFQEILSDTENMNVRTFHVSEYIARKAAENYFHN